jgi:1-aminocyclopropane-1-carboxylate deaminase/D-cysteine desulfhydrase-like pyridoxal-dependent ACC family enzyme
MDLLKMGNDKSMNLRSNKWYADNIVAKKLGKKMKNAKRTKIIYYKMGNTSINDLCNL